MYENVAIAVVILLAMALVGYLNKFQTYWIDACHTLGFSSKEKPSVVLAKMKELKQLEEDNDVAKYSDAKDIFGL